MGMGIGDWGLGIGDWAQSPIPNPQSPIPNPQSPFKLINKIRIKKLLKYIINFTIKIINKALAFI
jgi:hypothetical protein